MYISQLDGTHKVQVFPQTKNSISKWKVKGETKSVPAQQPAWMHQNLQV